MRSQTNNPQATADREKEYKEFLLAERDFLLKYVTPEALMAGLGFKKLETDTKANVYTKGSYTVEVLDIKHREKFYPLFNNRTQGKKEINALQLVHDIDDVSMGVAGRGERQQKPEWSDRRNNRQGEDGFSLSSEEKYKSRELAEYHIQRSQYATDKLRYIAQHSLPKKFVTQFYDKYPDIAKWLVSKGKLEVGDFVQTLKDTTKKQIASEMARPLNEPALPTGKFSNLTKEQVETESFLSAYYKLEREFLQREVSLFKVLTDKGFVPKEFSTKGISDEAKQNIIKQADLKEELKDLGVSLNYKQEEKHHEGRSPFIKNNDDAVIKVFGGKYFVDEVAGLQGDVITLTMEARKMGFVEAAKFLAEKYHVNLEKGQSESQTAKLPRVYYVKGEHRVSVNRVQDEASPDYGKYLYNSGESKSLGAGTAIQLVIALKKEEGVTVDFKQAQKLLSQYAVQKLDPEKLVEFTNTIKSLKGFDLNALPNETIISKLFEQNSVPGHDKQILDTQKQSIESKLSIEQ